MSVPAGFIIERVQDAIDTDADEVKVDILRNLNAVYLKIAESRPWSTLMETITNPGTILPGDLARVWYVEDNTDYLYFPVASGVKERYSSTRLYNWWKNMAVGTPLATGTDMATTMNSTTVTSATASFTSALIGEYIRVGDHPGIYKITSVPSATQLTLANAFHGADFSVPSTWASLSSQYYEIRPTGTLQIAYSDQNGATLTSTTLKLWYSRRPIPILNDYDTVLLPGTCEAVFIGVMNLMLKGSKYVNDAIREMPDYEVALSQMKSLDNLDDRFKVPRDRFGARIMFGRVRHTSAVSIHSDRYY